MKTFSTPVLFASHRWAALAIVAGAVVLVAGCGDKNKEKTATQTAAKVNKEEITVHQINFVLSQQRGLPPAQAASASRQVLERLIDQELALQKADEQKLDRDPRVVQQIEASRRDIIARAYLEKVGQGAPKPTTQEVNAYYEAHPGLFKNRRIYNLQEVNVEATPAQLEALRTALSGAKTFADFVAYLKSNNFKFGGAAATRAAEQLPLASVDQFAQLKDGQAVFTERPGGAQIIHLVASRMQPVPEDKAVPAIEQFLLNQRKRKLVADDLHALRTAAKIEYMGDFAADAARSPYQAPSAPELPPLTSIAPPSSEPAVTAAPQVNVAPIETGPASMPSGSTLDKGLKGFK
ncbi:MAG: EpsD family peptidyl-prolyl cis-trans isomerase [Caldimonas sp.]